MFGLPLAAYLGGVPPVQLPAFVLLGWLVHNAGFGMNSLVDYLYGYDLSDPSKSHHPLVAGRMSILGATASVFGLQLLSMFYFFMLSPHALMSQVAFGLYVLFGWAYNLLAKKNKWAAMGYLGVSMGSLFFAGATVLGVVTPLIIAASLYTAATVVFQIGVCGDLKDLAAGTEEVNILKQLGTHVEGTTMVTSRKGYIFAFSISAAKTAFLALFAYFVLPSWWWSIPVTVLAGATFFFFSYKELEGGRPYDHVYRLKLIGLGEVLAYILLIISAFPLLLSWALPAGIFFFILPVAYYYVMNRVIWPKPTTGGSGWAPGV